MILMLQPNAYAQELSLVLDLLEKVVVHLASYQAPPLDERGLLAAAPESDWLLGHRQTIDELLRCTRSEREQLAAALANDRQFDQNADSPNFGLQYPELPALVRKCSRPLFAAFYDKLIKGGHRLIGPDGETIVLDRRRLERGFFEANPGIRACPACLEAEIAPAGVRGVATNDCDHYLPKLIYGSLVIHPQNLVFTCMICNQRYKGQRDPLAAASPEGARARRQPRAGTLRGIYLPYRRAAIDEMRVEFERHRVILGADTAAARERMTNLDRLFGLAQTWTEVLPRAEREMFEELEGPVTDRTVKAVLDDVAWRGQRESPQYLKHGMFLRSRYAMYLRDHQLGVLTNEWMQRKEDLRKSQQIYAGSPHASTEGSNPGTPRAVADPPPFTPTAVS